MSGGGGYGLTPQQLKLLRFTGEFIAANGYGPSRDEMRRHMGFNSYSGVGRLVDALEERGRIRRMPHKSRAIEVLIPWDHKAEPEIVPYIPPRKVAHLTIRGRID